MKQISIKYGKKRVIITKDSISILVGIVIIISDILLAGLLQLFEFGFDASALMSDTFWSGYFLKLAIAYIALFGAYTIRKTANRHNPKFVTQREKIKDCKAVVVKHKKVGNFKNWLKYVYNYSKRVEKYQALINKKYEKLIFEEPEKPSAVDYDDTPAGKHKLAKATRKYNRRMVRYKKNEEMRKYCEQQLAICDIHFEIIQNYKVHNLEKVKALQAEIKETDCMKKYNLHYKNITYNKLFNVDLTSKKQDDSIEYNEATILVKKLLPLLLLGIACFALLSSVTGGLTQWEPETLLLIGLNLVMMLWFMFSGIRLADSFVLGTVFAADANRLMICEEYLEDGTLNGDDWTQEIDTNAEPEVAVVNKKAQENEQSGKSAGLET